MEIEVNGSEEPIEIGATGLAEIIQNVKIILRTAKGSVPLDREFGVDQSFLDLPLPAAKAALAAAVAGAVEKYEPRVKVTGVDFIESDAMEGVLAPVVRVIIQEEDI